MDTLYRFEFDEAFHINAIVIRESSFRNAINHVCLMLGDSILNYVTSIHLIS